MTPSYTGAGAAKLCVGAGPRVVRQRLREESLPLADPLDLDRDRLQITLQLVHARARRRRFRELLPLVPRAPRSEGATCQLNGERQQQGEAEDRDQVGVRPAHHATVAGRRSGAGLVIPRGARRCVGQLLRIGRDFLFDLHQPLIEDAQAVLQTWPLGGLCVLVPQLLRHFVPPLLY
ncbi:MAG: hypothetical protein U5K74_06915 [Gemmatimonadaceae bacterium]|nr:hypothetical protein [Gemmatimonadaceae bacterium]